MGIGHRKEIRKLTFRALPLVGANRRIMGCALFVYRKMELRYWSVHGNVESNRIYLIVH